MKCLIGGCLVVNASSIGSGYTAQLHKLTWAFTINLSYVPKSTET